MPVTLAASSCQGGVWTQPLRLSKSGLGSLGSPLLHDPAAPRLDGLPCASFHAAAPYLRNR